ncbi:MAG TPA: citramalate synthase [Syntrophales bacterium]|nr:citramalate synthase [Syntrophales bacterium]HOM07470.1 citramalate synthase [Syntrophales bacterium]HOO00005.1 citramalate synthase [Syntrophales bacterium]HPC00881.1 citramalate synthase [Syntrophales bacterium]HPQ07089.1 citramalate synthase [Syntrophales bacterium]
MSREILIYDTTLRDGAQGELINFTAEDKIRIARRLDEMGFHYIEGGWPGSNPKDVRFFEMARKIDFKRAKLAAFGSTRRADETVEGSHNIKALLDAETPVVTVFGKTWDLHVTEILQVSLEENLAMVGETVSYLKSKGREVIYDAEHFFDGYKADPSYAGKTLREALAAGADMIVLCDTNGGTLPHEVQGIVAEVKRFIPAEKLGIHAHNDGGLGVANTLCAVMEGVRMVQGTVNGYGERCGNADLVPVIANLQLKMGINCLSPEALTHLTNLSNYVADVANMPPINSRPFVGRSAFTHKGGVHVSAVLKNSRAYEHIDPNLVGNKQRVVVSDLAGKSNIEYKAQELGIPLGDDNGISRRIVSEIKRMEDEGYTFDAAEGSLELLIRKGAGVFRDPFVLECFQVISSKTAHHPSQAQAIIKVSVAGEEEVTAAEGNGPINALDNALRKALLKFYPKIKEMHLTDFKVRIVEGSEGTAAKVQVAIESRDGDCSWNTIGVSENVIEASWLALVDSINYKLDKDQRTAEQG